MAQPEPASPSARPKVPPYAWTWLQRSRKVLAEVAQQLYGEAKTDSGLLETLREDYASEQFVRDIVLRVVCDVAFNGRVPERRPAGMRWDRGLTWWAAQLAGVSVREFEARSTTASPPQQRLFGGGQPGSGPPGAAQPQASTESRRRPPLVSIERRAMINALRDLIAAGDGHTVPADAVRALLAELEADPAP